MKTKKERKEEEPPVTVCIAATSATLKQPPAATILPVIDNRPAPWETKEETLKKQKQRRTEQKKKNIEKKKKGRSPSKPFSGQQPPAAQPRSHSRSAPLPSSSSLHHLHCSAWTVESELIHSPLFTGPDDLSQPKISGPGPAQSKKNSKFFFFLKICDSSAYYSTKFCLILVCIFIS